MHVKFSIKDISMDISNHICTIQHFFFNIFERYKSGSKESISDRLHKTRHYLSQGRGLNSRSVPVKSVNFLYILDQVLAVMTGTK